MRKAITMEKKERPVYVVGHKNPDTDSICSAIAYANLKNKVNGGGYVPMRAGAINQETQYVLSAFQMSVPAYLSDVCSDVGDIEIRDVEGVSENISLRKAWDIMQEKSVVTLPVTKDKKLTGIITVGDLTNAYMDITDNCILATAKTLYTNILETINGTMLVGSPDGCFDKGEVMIATQNPDMMEDFIHEGDMVILGNRYESQLCAVEMNAGCIIVCMGTKVSITIQKLAQEHGCIVISTPYDTFTVARLINQSMSIGYFMRKDRLVTFKMTDKLDDIKEIMAKKRFRDFPILTDEGDYLGMISRRNLMNLHKKRLILVDHNEPSQAVDGIDDAELLEIIDHHRLGALETITPLFFRNQPLGCTATIIYQMYQEQGIEIEPQIAGLMMAAIISDTLMFRSPTCTAVDRMAAEALSEICNVEIEEFAIDMFGAGSDLSEKNAEEILHQDYKEFNANGVQFSVGQINSMNSIELSEVKEKLMEYMDQGFKDLQVDMCFYMLTNIVTESTELLCFGTKANELVQSAFNVSKPAETYHLKGLVSRKKQLIPSLVSALQAML